MVEEDLVITDEYGDDIEISRGGPGRWWIEISSGLEQTLVTLSRSDMEKLVAFLTAELADTTPLEK